MKIFIISNLRSKNVPIMEKLVGMPCTWIVGKGQVSAYKGAGASDVVEGGTLVESRNFALEMAFKDGQTCVQLSDDLKKIESLSFPEKVKSEINFENALRLIEQEMRNSPFKLYGLPPTANAFFVHKPINFNVFIIGDFIAVKPSEIRFDNKMKLKEDYDFTAQHIKKYGGVVRLDFLLATFQHYKNEGGCVSYRKPELEKEMVDYLMQKHPGLFRINPRRKNEVILKVRKGGLGKTPKIPS